MIWSCSGTGSIGIGSTSSLANRFATAGRPAEPGRFMIAMFLLKHTYSLSDRQLWERWVHDPYFQYFTGEEFFQHALPHLAPA